MNMLLSIKRSLQEVLRFRGFSYDAGEGAVLGYFTQRFTEVVLSFTEILWRLKALRFRGNSYDTGERCCAWFLHSDSQRWY